MNTNIKTIKVNDQFFSEYAYPNRLKEISNFTGSAGLAVILKDKNFLFVDGRNYIICLTLKLTRTYEPWNYASSMPHSMRKKKKQQQPKQYFFGEK